MNRKLIFASLALLLTLTAAQPLLAEDPLRRWDPDNGTPLRAGYHVEWYRGIEGRISGDFAGEVGIAWTDCRWTDTKLGDRAVWLQVLGTNGEFKFDEGGIRIADTENRQEDVGVWPSRSDGAWFLAWEDFDADTLGDIYCVKVDRNGNRLWARDDEKGVPVCVFPGFQEQVRIVEDRDGGCIVAWLDKRGGDDGDLYAMHIRADGTVDPNWTENGVAIVAEIAGQTNHTADSDGDGGMIIGWRDARRVSNADIWIQRINEDGELLWGDGEGILVCGADGNQESPKLCPDGANGAFISWVDERNSDQTGTDIWAQRINEDGEAMWADNGVAVCEVEREQKGNRIVASFSGEAIIAWNDKRTDNLTADVFSMRISGEGDITKHWNPSTGVPISAIDESNQTAVRLYPDGEGGAFYVWEDERNGGVPEVEIWSQRINRQGGTVWEDDGIPVSTRDGFNNSAAVRSTADGGAIFTWGIGPNGALGIYSQVKNGNGEDQWEENGIETVRGIASNARDASSIFLSQNNFVSIWSDSRFPDRGSLPFIQFIEDDNSESPIELLEIGGIPVLWGTDGGGVLQVATIDGAGGAIVAWEDHRRGDIYAIYAQRVTPEGDLSWGESGQKLAEGWYEQTQPEICEDGSGGAFVVWRSDTDDGYRNLFMQRINANGALQWGEAGLQVTNHEMDDEIITVTYDDSIGGVVLLYSPNNDETDDDIWAIRIDGDGDFLWGEDDGNGIVICDEYNDQRDVRMINHRYGFAMVWVDGRDSHPGEANNDIYAQVVNFDGEMLLENNGSFVAFSEYHEDYPDLATDNRANIWIVWENFRYAGRNHERGRDISVRRIRPELNQESGRLDLIWDGQNGKYVCKANKDQLRPRIMHDGHNGMWITWMDYREGILSDVFATHLKQSGDPYEPWEESGNPVCQAFHKQELPHLVALTGRGESGTAVVWSDKRATGKEELFNIYMQRLDDDVISVGEWANSSTPSGYSLEAAYPNPFNSKALINFVMAQEGRASLTLYDLSGRLVKEIAAERWSAGRHQAVIDGAGLASGTYLIKFEAENVSLEQKIQFLK